MRDIETHVAHMIDWLIEKGVFSGTIRNSPVNSNGTLSDDTSSYRSDLIRVRPQNLIMYIHVRLILLKNFREIKKFTLTH